MDYRAFFKGKKITVVGLGVLGRGVGDIRFLAEHGADLIVTDLKPAEVFGESLAALKEFPNIRYTLGRHDLADFHDRDRIINGPSVPLDSPYIAEARKHGIPVTMSTALFARFAREVGAKLAGITGTRGKTTTTHLIAEILRSTGLPVLMGGNVQGISTLALLPQVTRETVAVLELDSWQLQGFRDEKLSPDVAVFTTFYPDHLNYYKGDLDAYLADKAEIFLHQIEKDTLVLGEQCAPLVQEKYRDRIRGTAVVARAADIPTDWKLGIPGEHNRGNAACALLATRAMGVSDDASRAALEHFRGVAGRLELVRELRGVRIYNDTTATTPDATVAGLAALDPDGKQNILLIAGGADKGLDMSAMRAAVHAHCKKVFLLKGTGTERIRGDAPDAPVFDSLESALAAAYSAAQEGDIVLLSPAFASFGMFKNEYDRGDKFNAAVAALA